jgi:2-hydroxymethylglutarate dehydrogenase
MSVGFIGTGHMGARMAHKILEAGIPLAVHDIRKDAAVPLLEKGADWAGSPAEVAARCDVVFSSLPTPRHVSAVVSGENGLDKGWKRGDIYVDMSTNSPSLIRQIAADAAEMGVTVMDAPVSGGPRRAEEGTLTIMVGGPEDALKKIRRPLEAMGNKIVRVGDVGCGSTVKLVNNLINLGCGSVSAEGFVLGVKGGIDPQILWEIICSGTGDNWAMRQFPDTTFRGNFEPGFRVELAYKDINLALDLGEAYGVPLATAETIRDGLRNAIEAGFAEKGVDAVILPLEQKAAVNVRSGD